MERKGFVTKRWLWFFCSARAESHTFVQFHSLYVGFTLLFECICPFYSVLFESVLLLCSCIDNNNDVCLGLVCVVDYCDDA